MYILTEEGKKYLIKGLPEKRLIIHLKKPKKIGELQKTPDFKIALQWAKKNGWVKIEKGSLIPVSKPSTFPQEDILKKISQGQKVNEKTIRILVQRKLVVKQREDIFKKAEKQIQQGVTTPTPELIKTGLWKKVKFKPYNVSASGKKMYPGKRQPYNLFLSEVKRRLIELGFKEMSGPIIETEFWNFDALFQPQNHPSRDWTQTYSLKNPTTGSLPAKDLVSRVKSAHESGWRTGSTGWGYKWNPEKATKLMPRAHGTAISARTLSSLPEIPGKYFSISRCFRPDVIDATHGVEFNQVEGIVIGQGLTFKNLLGVLSMFAKEFAGAEEIKFLPDYYPFTEPSVQLSAKHPELGWVEFGGAGIFREELTQPLGIKEPVIAWGIGIDRLAMFKLGINDIRNMFSKDLNWLRNSKVIV